MRGAIFLLATLLATPAAAALTVQVATAAGKPAPDAVVMLRAVGRPTPAARIETGYAISQKNIRFNPFVSIVAVGSDVTFPNLDTTRHHVYSFSPTKRFELKLYAKDQTRAVHFDKPGIVALGCNIHDSMSAFIFVTDSLWTAPANARGIATLNPPPGTYVMTVWHPYLRAPANQVQRQIEIGSGDRRETVSAEFRAPPLHDMSAY